MSKRWIPWWIRKHRERKAKAQAVRERDGDNCWQCGHAMRFGPPYNIGKSATVEHLIPLSERGTWALENLVLCHKGCNKHLGINTREQKQRMRLRVG